MKYSDLIRFDPIETAVPLREADHATSARRRALHRHSRRDQLADAAAAGADAKLELPPRGRRVRQGSRFRLFAGIQERLFDNPRFQIAADSLRQAGHECQGACGSHRTPSYASRPGTLSACPSTTAARSRP